MDKECIKKVFVRVQQCMESLVGGSGHLVSYSLLPDTFCITKEEKLEEGKKIYHFTVKAYRESEFTTYNVNHQPEPEAISGRIVLDTNFDLVCDDRGEVMIEPWKCVGPLKKKKVQSSKEKAKELLYEKLQSAASIISKIKNEYSRESSTKISVLLDDIQERLNGFKISSDLNVDYTYLLDIYVNVIMGVIGQDMLTPDDEIKLLQWAIEKRLENFDEYFEKLEKNELKRPYCPRR